jgi:hypothetical protein
MTIVSECMTTPGSCNDIYFSFYRNGETKSFGPLYSEISTAVFWKYSHQSRAEKYRTFETRYSKELSGINNLINKCCQL